MRTIFQILHQYDELIFSTGQMNDGVELIRLIHARDKEIADIAAVTPQALLSLAVREPAPNYADMLLELPPREYRKFVEGSWEEE